MELTIKNNHSFAEFLISSSKLKVRNFILCCHVTGLILAEYFYESVLRPKEFY